MRIHAHVPDKAIMKDIKVGTNVELRFGGNIVNSTIVDIDGEKLTYEVSDEDEKIIAPLFKPSGITSFSMSSKVGE